MRRQDKTIVFLIGICAVLFLTKLVIQTDINIQSDRYTEIEQQVKDQDAQNRDIKSKIDTLSSLQVINEKARQQGFIDATKYYIVK